MKVSFLIIPMLLLGAAAKKRAVEAGAARVRTKLAAVPNKRATSEVVQAHADQPAALRPSKDGKER